MKSQTKLFYITIPNVILTCYSVYCAISSQTLLKNNRLIITKKDYKTRLKSMGNAYS